MEWLGLGVTNEDRLVINDWELFRTNVVTVFKSAGTPLEKGLGFTRRMSHNCGIIIRCRSKGARDVCQIKFPMICAKNSNNLFETSYEIIPSRTRSGKPNVMNFGSNCLNFLITVSPRLAD
jgi:hypothetical protein